MPPKIKIVDVVDKEIESDAYTIANDEVKECGLPTENEQLETTNETTAIVKEKHETTPEEISTNTTTTEPATQIRNQELVQCEKCNKFVTPKTLKYTHGLKCGENKRSRPNKSEIKINENVQEEEAPPTHAPISVPVQKEKVVNKPPVQRTQPPKTVVKEVVKSYEEMRKERHELH